MAVYEFCRPFAVPHGFSHCLFLNDSTKFHAVSLPSRTGGDFLFWRARSHIHSWWVSRSGGSFISERMPVHIHSSRVSRSGGFFYFRENAGSYSPLRRVSRGWGTFVLGERMVIPQSRAERLPGVFYFAKEPGSYAPRSRTDGPGEHFNILERTGWKSLPESKEQERKRLEFLPLQHSNFRFPRM